MPRLQVLATPTDAAHPSSWATRPGGDSFAALWGADFTPTGSLPKMVADVEQEALEAGAYVLGLRKCGEELKVSLGACLFQRTLCCGTLPQTSTSKASWLLPNMHTRVGARCPVLCDSTLVAGGLQTMATP